MTAPLPPSRPDRLRALGDTQFDLLVVGGGITGAGIARDAARRGLTVALVERDDFGGGTSSRSSRLIHGGVRYLEHGYLHLVFEASRERRRLLRLAPHLVTPLHFTWPVYRGARIPAWQLRAGLALYDALAMFRNVGRAHSLSTAEIAATEPALMQTGLRGGAAYWDAATDDARLTLANVLDAAAAGAVTVNHAEVSALRFSTAHGRADGAVVRDRLDGSEIEVRARLVLNACGPWTDALIRLEDESAPPAVRGTKGVHIAVAAERVRNVGAITLLSPTDGRVMFALPSGAQTIFGTTDTPTTAHPDEVRAAPEDVRYLLAAANHFFPEARLTEGDVISAWAGIRPLVASGNTGSPASASREHAITLTRRGVLTVTGGKLTTYRAMAEQSVDAAVKALKVQVRRCDTATAPLPGNARDHSESPLAPGLAWSRAAVDRAIREEMAETVGDVLIRRTHVAFETADQGRSVAGAVARALAGARNWTDSGVRQAEVDYEREIARIFAITPEPPPR